jgi:hypothetical protein
MEGRRDRRTAPRVAYEDALSDRSAAVSGKAEEVPIRIDLIA